MPGLIALAGLVALTGFVALAGLVALAGPGLILFAVQLVLQLLQLLLQVLQIPYRTFEWFFGVSNFEATRSPNGAVNCSAPADAMALKSLLPMHQLLMLVK